MQEVAWRLKCVEQLAFLFKGLLRRRKTQMLEVGLGPDLVAQLCPQIRIRTADMMDDKAPLMVNVADREGTRSSHLNHRVDLVDGQSKWPL